MRIKTTLLGAAGAVFAAGASAGPAWTQEVLWGGSPEFRQGGDRFNITGRFEYDVGFVDGEDFGADSYLRSEARRARLGLRGRTAERIAYRLEVAFEETDEVNIDDAFVEFRGAAAALRVGQFREPVSLSRQTASPFLSTMERAAFTSAFGFERRAGVALRTGGDNWTVVAAAFGDNVNNTEAAQDESYAVALRGTYAPINTGDMVVQVGGSVRYRDAGDDGLFAYNAQPNVGLAPSFVGTGALGFAENDLFLGVEAAGVMGPFHASAEYGWLDAEGPLLDATFQGAYLEAGYFLTGETRNLNAAQGAFGRTRVISPVTEGGMGAFEVRGRIDYLDLSDGAAAFGEQLTYSIGLNWHATNYVRVLGEYVYADIDESPAAAGADGEVNALQVRTAVDW